MQQPTRLNNETITKTNSLNKKYRYVDTINEHPEPRWKNLEKYKWNCMKQSTFT